MRMRVIVASLATAALIPALSACGSNDDNTKTDAPSSKATVAAMMEPFSVPAATQQGLEKMVALAKQIAAADAATGKTLAEGLEGFWAPIEDGIKGQSSTTYLNIEDAMANLESGDVAKAGKGATALEAAVSAYTGK